MDVFPQKKFIESKLEMFMPNVGPTKVSLAGVILITVAAVLAFLGHNILAAVLVILSGLFDIFDGMIARKYKTKSHKGYVADRICDRISDGIIIIAMGILYSPVLGMAALFLTFLSSYVGIVAEGILKGQFVGRTTLRPLRIIATAVGFISGKGVEALIVLTGISLYSTLYRLVRIIIHFK